MKKILFHTTLCLLAVSIPRFASGQAAVPVPAPAQAPAQETPVPKEQTLSKQIASDCYNKRRLAIRAVNLKYIDLTKAAAELFTKENNQPRTDAANTWIKNLVWANDANFKEIAPETKDRLGELQAAYIKERVNAIVTANTACVEDVEAALKKAAAAGDQAGIAEMTKLEDRIKQELRSIAGGAIPGMQAAAAELTAAGKVAADYYSIRTTTIKGVNNKYIALAQDAMSLYAKEGNDTKALEAKDWARRLQWTDGGNLLGMSPDTTDRLGVLQTTYLKEREKAVTDLDKLNVDKIEAAQMQAMKDRDVKGLEDLNRISNGIKNEIAGKNPAPARPPVVAAPTPALAQNPESTPASEPPSQARTFNPFGVTEEQFNRSIVSPLPPLPTPGQGH